MAVVAFVRVFLFCFNVFSDTAQDGLLLFRGQLPEQGGIAPVHDEIEGFVSFFIGLLGMECSLRVLCQPALLGIRARTGIEIVAARVTGGQRLVAMQACADGIRNCVVGPAHDGKDIPVSGTCGQGAETAGGEAYPQRIRRGAFLVMGGPVILRPDTVRLVDLTDVGILVLLCEERRRGILPGHEGDGVGGIAHLVEETVTHFPVQLFHRFIQGEPYGAAHQVHFPAVAAEGTDGRCLLQHL